MDRYSLNGGTNDPELGTREEDGMLVIQRGGI